MTMTWILISMTIVVVIVCNIDFDSFVPFDVIMRAIVSVIIVELGGDDASFCSDDDDDDHDDDPHASDPLGS